MAKEENNTLDMELAQTVMKEAADLATAISKHIAPRKHIHAFGMTVVGYAVEMMMQVASEESGQDFDQMSAEWLSFMRQAHQDIKRIAQNKSNKQGS